MILLHILFMLQLKKCFLEDCRKIFFHSGSGSATLIIFYACERDGTECATVRYLGHGA